MDTYSQKRNLFILYEYGAGFTAFYLKIQLLHDFNKLKFMFMKHYALNRCEPSIEVLMKMGVQWGGGGRVFFWGVSGYM